jgi:hypothetical protein
MYPKENLIGLKERANKRSGADKNEGEGKKKKVGSKRTHTRMGTESTEFLHKKLNSLIFQSKIKIFAIEEKRKKPASRRN